MCHCRTPELIAALAEEYGDRVPDPTEPTTEVEAPAARRAEEDGVAVSRVVRR